MRGHFIKHLEASPLQLAGLSSEWNMDQGNARVRCALCSH